MTTPVVLIAGALKVLAGPPVLPSRRQERALLGKLTLRMVMRRINGGTAMSLPVVRSRNELERNALRFAAAVLVALASFVAAPNAALTQAPQHHDQVPGFYRQKVGGLEVTALFDGHAVFDPHWLNGTKATMDGVVEALHEDPSLLDVSDEGFLVNTGKQLILVDAGAGTGWGGGVLGRLLGSLRSAGYTPEEVDIVLVTHLHSDHVGGLTTQVGKRVFPKADVYVANGERQ
jgi:beta-lactamase superfamily II metal-dependent hydrolase